MKNVLLIALLAFTGLSHSSDAGEGDTYKACWLRDNAWQFNLNLERCPGLEKGDVIGAIHPIEAVLYCDGQFEYKGDIYCKYNGKETLPFRRITQKGKGTRDFRGGIKAN